MRDKRGNSLVVIEGDSLTVYALDDKREWTVGRLSKDNNPDIRLQSLAVSRYHGKLVNTDGVWFYADINEGNGTVYNGKHIENSSLITLKTGDILIFGKEDDVNIDSNTAWALFTTRFCDEIWNVADTDGFERIIFSDGNENHTFDNPKTGMVFENDNGIAIYMGTVTFIVGDIKVSGI